MPFLRGNIIKITADPTTEAVNEEEYTQNEYEEQIPAFNDILKASFASVHGSVMCVLLLCILLLLMCAFNAEQ